MRKKLLNLVTALLLAVLVTPLAACSQDATPTEPDQTPPETKQAKEEIYLKNPVPTCGLEASGVWNAWQYVTGGPEISDGITHEDLEFEEITLLYELFDVQEFDTWEGNHDWPASLHVTLADGTDGDITNNDVINDLWDRILCMRVSPDLAMVDPGTFANNVFTFSWDDGRRQTFTFTGQTALTVDGTLFPLIEGVNAGGEVFNGWSVTPLKNIRYPEVVFDTARMVIEDSLGKRTVFFIKSGTTNMRYSHDTFSWNANDDDYVEDYAVKPIKGTADTPGGILIEMKNSSDPLSCVIEGATRLYVIEMARDDNNYIYPTITYQPEDSEERATCTIKMVGGKLAVDYL